MACRYTVGPEMHPINFAVHTHALGKEFMVSLKKETKAHERIV